MGGDASSRRRRQRHIVIVLLVIGSPSSFSVFPFSPMRKGGSLPSLYMQPKREKERGGGDICDCAWSDSHGKRNLSFFPPFSTLFHIGHQPTALPHLPPAEEVVSSSHSPN